MYALIYGMLSALTVYVLYKLDIEIKGVSSFINFAIATVCILIPVNQYKSSNNNELTIPNALVTGLIIGSIGGLLYAIYVYFHLDIINPDFLAEKLAEAKVQMESQDSQMTNEQLKQSIKFTEMILSPIVLSIIGFIGALIETFLVALVIGLIKKS